MQQHQLNIVMEPGNGRKNVLHSQNLLRSIPMQPHFNENHHLDITTKSEFELKDTLERQEKMLKNRMLLSKLPDGGEKLIRSVNRLRKRLSELNGPSSSAHEHDLTLSASSSIADETTETARVDENTTSDNQTTNTSDDLMVIERGFKQLSIHEGPFYEVVKNANLKSKKSKFVLHRQAAKIKPTNDDSCPPEVAASKAGGIAGRTAVSTTAAQTSVSSADHRTPHTIPLSAPSDPRSAVVISVEECRQLHTQQQVLIKEQRATLTAERLASKFGLGDGDQAPGPAHPEEGDVGLEQPEEGVVGLEQPEEGVVGLEQPEEEGEDFFVTASLDDLIDLEDVD